MRLSRTSRYALRAVVHLARSGGERIPAGKLSSELDLPENYLSKTLNALAHGGILDAARGPGGGFRLVRKPDELPLIEVIEPFETLGAGQECVLGRPECSEEDPCPAHEDWKRVASRIEAFFRETTVGDVVGDRPTPPFDALPTDAPRRESDD